MELLSVIDGAVRFPAWLGGLLNEDAQPALVLSIVIHHLLDCFVSLSWFLFRSRSSNSGAACHHRRRLRQNLKCSGIPRALFSRTYRLEAPSFSRRKNYHYIDCVCLPATRSAGSWSCATVDRALRCLSLKAEWICPDYCLIPPVGLVWSAV